MSDLLNRASDGLVSDLKTYFSGASESVYAIATLNDIEGYLLFSIKAHKEFRPSSVKVFNTTDYTNFRHLETSIREFIVDANRGRYSLFKFKLGSFTGLMSIINIGKLGFQLVTSIDNYAGTLTDDIYLVPKKEGVDHEPIKVVDEVFLNRLVKLVHCGLVKGHPINDRQVRFYVTEFGFRLLNSNKEIKQNYKYRLKHNDLYGQIENQIKGRN
jgi:hypothetical protein